MAAKRILMLVGDYVEDYEVMVPFHALRMVGRPADAVCPDKAAGQTVRTAVHDFEGDQTYSEKPGHNFALNAAFADVKAEQYDALVLPGGRAPEYLRLNEAVLRLVRHFAEKHPPIPALCPGVRLPTAARGLGGRSCPPHPPGAPAGRGAPRLVAGVAVDQAHADGSLVTAPAWPAHPRWLAKFLDVLGTRIHHG